MMKNRYFLLFVVSTLCVFGVNAQKAKSPSYFYAIGDMPYAADQVEKYENLVQHINRESPSFTIHVGDTKSGSSDCSDLFYSQSLKDLNRFKQPLIYTPGDNEWTDCDRESCGGYDAEERLNLLRKTMFVNPSESFGVNKIKVTSQSSVPSFEKYVENVMWKHKEVLFATVHICGSSNNYQTELDNQEFLQREAADLYWLREIFRKAKEENVRGIVMAFHANMFGSQKDEGYKNTLDQMKQLIFEFKKPVLAIYGDTHTYTVSQPLGYNGQLLTNFTALQVFGSPSIYPVKVIMDKEKGKLFDFEPVYQF